MTAKTDRQARSARVELVAVTARWCRQCRAMEPVLEDVVARSDGELALRRVDVDIAAREAIAAGVTSIPTTIVLVDGGETGRIVGRRSSGRFAEDLARLTGASRA